ncbi:MAG TPA: AAA family ATPase [Tepidimicrobium sp.]|nr:AAA family ATPase [Tepidimicrobium sp.]
MKLKELNLISFGKFQGKRIRFKEGLNIIYGENESGKTTIHNFIDGMFYGFLRPYVTRRYYREEYEKYRPWGRESYKGVLRFSKDGIDYRIERDFRKGEVRVYEDLTGKDITKNIDAGERVKVHLPGMYFFDFNTTVYNNTVSIKQLGNRIDSNLSAEVKDRLANISTSLDDDISVKDAISQLDKQLESIGTKNAYTKPYGKALRQLKGLMEERKEILQKREEYDRYIDESYILRERIEAKRSRIKKLEEDLKKVEILGAKQKYDEIMNIKKELKSIDGKIENLKVYSKLSFDDYSKGLKLDSDRGNLDREIADLSDRLKGIEYELAEIGIEKDAKVIDGIKVDKLYEDMDRYDEMDREKNELIMSSRKNRLEILNSRLLDMEGKLKRSKNQRLVSILLTVVLLVLGLLNPMIMFASPLSTGLAFYFNGLYRRNKEEMEGLREEITRNRLEEDEKSNKIQWINKQQDAIMKKYDCSSKTELNRLYEDIRLKFASRKDRESRRRRLKADKENLQIKLEVKRKQKQELIEEMDLLMKKNSSTTLDEFKKGLKKKNLYDSLLKDRNGKKEILDNLLGDTTLEELKNKAHQYDKAYIDGAEDMDKDLILADIKEEEEALSTLTNDLTRLEERIDGLDKAVGNLVNIEEEIYRLEQSIQYFVDRIESINIAKAAIEKISEAIHEQFAPDINKWVSKVIYRVTGGKYDRISISDDLDITIENPITGEMIDVDSLSGGTIDQLYFALRFSIINSIEESSLPLILDDCFIQYDNERLRNILKFLGEVCEDKQILLFTCHRREEEVLKELGLKYNLILI